MPRCIRNFWIELNVDGKRTPVATGPRRADGGFALRIFMRENGSVSEKVLRISGSALHNGTLILNVTGQGESIAFKTSR
jgi:hypothetical protein